MTMELVSSSSLLVHDFSNKKLKKVYPDLNNISHFIRNKSDLKLKTLLFVFMAFAFRKLYTIFLVQRYFGSPSMPLFDFSIFYSRTLLTTKFQPTDARKAYPCLDEPDLKATFNITMVHPTEYKALSNMPVESSVVNGGWNITVFGKTVKMSTYLIAFIVCDFEYKQNITGIGNNITVSSNNSFNYSKKESEPNDDFFISNVHNGDRSIIFKAICLINASDPAPGIENDSSLTKQTFPELDRFEYSEVLASLLRATKSSILFFFVSSSQFYKPACRFYLILSGP